MPFWEIIQKANNIRKKNEQTEVQLCSIINAKSGKCSEDCKYCAQSSHHHTAVAIYSLKSQNEIFEKAKKAKQDGATKFGIVTSGNSLTEDELDVIAKATKQITTELSLSVCGSLGALTEANLQKLKDAGMTRYHHNIETSREFYPKIVSTHTFDDRVKTIKLAKKLGMSVCSGGILGLGETFEDRISMALTLKELNVDSVPLNILVPVKGTKLENADFISNTDVIRSISIFRIILQDKEIRFAGGRETKLKDFQSLGFLAGANAMMIGGYLTINGREVDEDLKLKKEIEKLWKM